MNRNVLIVVVIILVLGCGYLFIGNKSRPAETLQPTPTPVTAVVSSVPEVMKKVELAVTLTENGFEPQTITVKVGEKIVWTNKSGSTSTVHSNPHPIHTDYKLLNLGKFDDGEILEFTASEKGTYKYHDHLHPSKTGTVVVE